MNVWCFALSCLYAKRSGFKIVLHTDKKGAELLKSAPYDKIIVDLEDQISPRPRIFAWPKFKALQNEDEGAIHIDGDVFLKKGILRKLMKFDDCDIIVQSKEIKGMYQYGYLWEESTQSFAHCEYPSFLPRRCKTMYNCGVIGFKDKKLWEEYNKWYWYLIDQYNCLGIDMCSVPDLIAEQQLLYEFAKHKNLKVRELINFESIQDSAKEIGYQHLLGSAKFRNLDKIKQILKAMDINIYNKLEEIKWDI